VVRAVLQAHRVAHLAVRKGGPAHTVQCIAVGQLGLTQRAELLRCCMQFEFGGQGGYHTNSVSYLHQTSNARSTDQGMCRLTATGASPWL
jgi:hypothetical protein